MGKKDPRVDAYIAKSPEYARPILKHLRKLVHQACPKAEETLKWSQPFFLYHGMLCGMSGFKNYTVFGCWKDKLMTPEMVGFGKAGKNIFSRVGQLKSLADLPGDRELLAYIKAGARLNEAGVKTPRTAPRKKKPVVVPDYFKAALQKNKKARAAFEAFSPSHQREYIEWITGAKGEDTRQRRIAQALAWMAEGKSRNWKYVNC